MSKTIRSSMATSKGQSPRSEYGGGAVLLWDRGTWSPIGDPHRSYRKGHLEFTLKGEKLKGRWHLVRMARKRGEKRENWLLIKGDDGVARTAADPDILEERPESVSSGRQIAEITSEAPSWSSKTGRIRKTGRSSPSKAEHRLDPSQRSGANASAADMVASLKGARRLPMPAFVEPSLATLVGKVPSGALWIHEIKFDGYRLEARIDAGSVTLTTRGGLDWTRKFGTRMVEALAALPVSQALVDGELVVESGNGASNFSALQSDLSQDRTDRFTFYAFDLVYLDGYDLRAVPLVERKELLRRVLPEDANGPVRYSSHFDENGALVLRHACRLSLEGIVSKQKNSPYRSGRGKDWVKSKCSARQEFVIAGFVPSTTSGSAIGSLVMGAFDHGKLVHVGRVGTGFSQATSRDLYERLESIRVETSPFGNRLSADEARRVRFVNPELVAEVEFRAWTADGHLRHASFRGLRDDKPASEIVREVSVSSSAATEPPRRTVALSHPERLYWPEQGVTKEGLADYYAEVWRFMGPHVVGRPLALLRCPTGIDGQKFFQKHAWKGLNKNIVLVRDPKEQPDKPLISINDLDGLIGLVQAASLEIHPWGSTVTDWEKPDVIIMDLDPGEGVSWEAVVTAAHETRERLKRAGLTPFVKTSGGKGLHVVAPLKPDAQWPAVKAFSKSIADAMASDSPDRYVSTIAKSKRRGKILVDYLRNQRGATAVAPYSTRARPGAPVSTPLAWEELGPAIGPAYFTVENLAARLQALADDPWADFRRAAAAISPDARRRRRAA